MGRRGAGKKEKNVVSGPRASMTLREEATGRRQRNVSARTMCRIEHLRNLALWAATEACIPSLGAFFGQRLAASAEAVGVRPDSSLFFCERCESILHPGQNCTVRVKKNKSNKQRGHKKSDIARQKNVIYYCHFCCHRNLMRRTPKGYIQEISPSKTKRTSSFNAANHVVERSTSPTQDTPLVSPTAVEASKKMDAVAFPITETRRLEPSSPSTPLLTAGLSLLDAKMRKRKRRSAKQVTEPEGSSTAAAADKSICTSSKRRRKSWTSLKEIAQNAENDTIKKFTNLTIPFCM
ncbi:hypothetical protein F511_07391 [Dorcoceras hygrometricum]|uniref:Uncharacterized protein n=1 Tax=Dorcoceras hygrometricum TaxID=472368 RepID=A0A2Z7BBB0_9LAMI|nr:hypothetical protein F511_07391 [Dorcoceras hygrometricum]